MYVYQIHEQYSDISLEILQEKIDKLKEELETEKCMKRKMIQQLDMCIIKGMFNMCIL